MLLSDCLHAILQRQENGLSVPSRVTMALAPVPERLTSMRSLMLK